MIGCAVRNRLIGTGDLVKVDKLEITGVNAKIRLEFKKPFDKVDA